MDNLNYIYLLQEREFVKCNENIYKIGKTKKDQFTRFNQYPNGSILLLQIKCNDCDCNEREIIKLFKSKYTHKKQIGHEYFEGDYEDMMKNIFNIVLKNNGKKGSYCVNDVVDDVVDEVVKVAKPVVVKVEPVAVKAKTPKASYCIAVEAEPVAKPVAVVVKAEPVIIINDNVRVYTPKASKLIQHARTALDFLYLKQCPIYETIHPKATKEHLNKFIYEYWNTLTSKQQNEYYALETADQARFYIDIDGKSSSKHKRDLKKYLNHLTVNKLITLCRFLKISYSGNKANIIKKFIDLDYKQNIIKNIINCNINQKYLILCVNTSHTFFSNYNYSSYNFENNNKEYKCSICKCKTTMIFYDNEFYDTSI